jgi:hypothetical protein
VSDYDPMDDVAQIELNEDRWEEYANGLVAEIGLTGREAQLFVEGWTRAAFELYQNFGGVPAAEYPPAAQYVPGVAKAVGDALA